MTVAYADLSDPNVGSRITVRRTEVVSVAQATFPVSATDRLIPQTTVRCGGGVVRVLAPWALEPLRMLVSRTLWWFRASAFVRECPAPRALGRR